MEKQDVLLLDILTPTGPATLGSRNDLAEGIEVPGVEVPGLVGEVGIRPNHIPFVTPIRPGVVRFKRGAGSVRLAVGAGFLEVAEGGRVSILTSRASEPSEIDLAEVSTELAEVREQLKTRKDSIDDPEARKLSLREEWLVALQRAAEHT